MKCKCQHSSVCPHRQALIQIGKVIIEPVIPGPAKGWVKLEEMVQTLCRHRLPIIEEKKEYKMEFKD